MGFLGAMGKSTQLSLERYEQPLRGGELMNGETSGGAREIQAGGHQRSDDLLHGDTTQINNIESIR